MRVKGTGREDQEKDLKMREENNLRMRKEQGLKMRNDKDLRRRQESHESNMKARNGHEDGVSSYVQ